MAVAVLRALLHPSHIISGQMFYGYKSKPTVMIKPPIRIRQEKCNLLNSTRIQSEIEKLENLIMK